MVISADKMHPEVRRPARMEMGMRALRIAIVLLLCAAAAGPGWADEKVDRLVTAFAKVCLAKPASMSAINELATVQGFALDKDGAAALRKAASEDPFNLLLFWRSGTGESRMRLTGLISGSADRYELGCILDGYGVTPLGLLAALKPILGEPDKRSVRENNWVDLAWTAAGGATLSYKEGEQGRVSLTLVRILGKSAGPQ
jgi:hypothetical protein